MYVSTCLFMVLCTEQWFLTWSQGTPSEKPGGPRRNVDVFSFNHQLHKHQWPPLWLMTSQQTKCPQANIFRNRGPKVAKFKNHWHRENVYMVFWHLTLELSCAQSMHLFFHTLQLYIIFAQSFLKNVFEQSSVMYKSHHWLHQQYKNYTPNFLEQGCSHFSSMWANYKWTR